MFNVSWSENILKLNNKKISFEFDILEVLQIKDFVLIVTEPQINVFDNLYGISINTGEIWKVQKLKEIYPGFTQTPYVGVSIVDSKVLVTDFCGCRFIVNHTNGKIIGREQEVK